MSNFINIFSKEFTIPLVMKHLEDDFGWLMFTSLLGKNSLAYMIFFFCLNSGSTVSNRYDNVFLLT